VDKNGDATMWPELQTMQMTYQRIVEGERPWNALGDFLTYWFQYAADRREALVSDPIQEPVGATPEQHRWAALCAALVDYQCSRAGISCPDWAAAPTYTLSDPWFVGLGAHKPEIQARLLRETPAPFARRNIYGEERTFGTKYDCAASARRRSSTVP
jgi:hypothetical protein